MVTKLFPRAKDVVRELFEKAPLAVPDEGWQAHYALFARAGFTAAAAALAAASEALLVDLPRLVADLQAELTGGGK